VTPAHDLTDYQIGQKNNLPLIEVIDEKGKISSDMPELYRGLATTDARKKIVEDLERLKLIEKVEDYKNQIPKCYRCNSTIELIPSQQWFLEMKELAKIAAKPVENDEIKFHPSRWKSIYLDWIKNANHDKFGGAIDYQSGSAVKSVINILFRLMNQRLAKFALIVNRNSRKMSLILGFLPLFGRLQYLVGHRKQKT